MAAKFYRGMVFGVFDGLHLGHEYFLTEAVKQCDELVVVVTIDDVVLHFKNRLPKFGLAERMEKIKDFSEILTQNFKTKVTVLAGDSVGEMGQWNVLKNHQPNVVFIGYDQGGIGDEMDKLGLPTVTIQAHYPEKYKSSIINL